MHYRKNALAALFALAFAFQAYAAPENKDPGNSGARLEKCDSSTQLDTRATVMKDVDGDTIHIEMKGATYSVRMLGMDTPETHFMGKSQGKWGEEAARALAEMIPVGTPVTLEFGSRACDGHGRVLAHVFKDGTHVNAEMVKRGLAVNYCVAPEFNYCEEFMGYVQNAIDHKQGMFSDKDFELPYDFRRRIGNEPQRSYVGDLVTKIVHGPGHQNDTPIANRVFFYTRELVRDPYHVVGDDVWAR